MPVIVSDTSPIRAIANLDLLDMLPSLFGEVLVPPAVEAELLYPPNRSHAVDVSAVEGVRVVPLSETGRAATLRKLLDPGESEALALAEQRTAEALLIDELAGRRVATAMGLRAVGTLAVLLEAKQRGLVHEIIPLIDRLEAEFGFFMSQALRAHIVREAGEP